MSEIKKLSFEKKYVLGIFAAGVIYSVVRCLFAQEPSYISLPSNSADVTQLVLSLVYAVVLCGVLCFSFLLAKRKNVADLSCAVPFLLICGLGLWRFYLQGTSYSPVAIVFLVTLICNMISALFGFHFAGIGAIISAFFLAPSLVPAISLSVVVAPVCAMNSQNEKKKNLSLLCIALELLLLLALGGYAFSHYENGEKTDFSASQIIIAVIFAVIYLVPFAILCIKKATAREKTVGLSFFVIFAVSLVLSAFCGEMSSTMSVICSASLPITASVIITDKNCPQLYSLFGKFADNKPVFFLTLAFFCRAVAFFFVKFESIT